MFTPSLKILPLLLLQCVMLPGISGCHSSAGNSGTKLEHHVPPHKPQGFSELVTSLRERIAGLGRGVPSEESLNELADLVHWIPEIAAETDLRQKEWDVAAGVSRKLGTRFDAARHSGNFDASAIHELLDLAELLQPLADLCTHTTSEPTTFRDRIRTLHRRSGHV